MEPTVAVQTTNEPTNKLAAGANTAAGVGAILAAVMAAYGADAIREMMTAMGLGGYPALINLVVMGVTGVAGWWATKRAALLGGYNVLDKPNVALQPAAKP